MGTLEEYVRDQTSKFSTSFVRSLLRVKACSYTITVVQNNLRPVGFNVVKRMGGDIDNTGREVL